jgi:hypothetical protein
MIEEVAIKHKHHIIPRHMGGSDDPANLILLTIEEHAEAHRILYETYNKIEDKRAWLGLAKIMSGEEIISEILRQPKSDEWKQKNRKPKKDKSKYFNNTNARGNLGKSKTDIHCVKISKSMLGKNVGKLRSEETKAKLVAAQARQPVRQCPHCGTVGKGANMTRYHFEKCKVIKND